MNEPNYCPIARKWCTCEKRCEDAPSAEAQLRWMMFVNIPGASNAASPSGRSQDA